MSWNIAKPGDQINGPVAVTGNLNVDSNTLFVDSANNRVGVLTASPTVPLDVVGDAKVSGNLTVDTNTLVVDAANNRLGIGTPTPGARLDINAGTNLNLAVGGLTLDNFTNDGVGITFSRTTDDGDLMALGVCDTDKLGLFSREGLIFATGGAALYGQTSEKMRLDGSGNLGLGVTPSANWNSTVTGSKAIEIGFGSVSSDLNFVRTELVNNAINGSSGWVYRYALAGATRYSQTLTEHRWFNAGTTLGTAGGAIAFTQAMTLDASGRLLIGGTSTYDFAGQANLVVNGTSNNATLTIASTGAGYLAFADGTTGTSRYVGRIDYDHGTDQMALTANAVERLLIKKNGQVNFVGLASDPAGAAAGDVYYNTTTNKLKCYNGTTWNDLF